MAEYISDKPSSEYQYGDQSKSGMYRPRNSVRSGFRATEKRACITEADDGVGGIFRLVHVRCYIGSRCYGITTLNRD